MMQKKLIRKLKRVGLVLGFVSFPLILWHCSIYTSPSNSSSSYTSSYQAEEYSTETQIRYLTISPGEQLSISSDTKLNFEFPEGIGALVMVSNSSFSIDKGERVECLSKSDVKICVFIGRGSSVKIYPGSDPVKVLAGVDRSPQVISCETHVLKENLNKNKVSFVIGFSSFETKVFDPDGEKIEEGKFFYFSVKKSGAYKYYLSPSSLCEEKGVFATVKF